MLILLAAMIPFQASAAASATTILNSAKLSPLKTGYAPLDNAVEDIFSKIFTSKMTTYDKVWAINEWIIHNITYKNVSECFYDSYGIRKMYPYDIDGQTVLYAYTLFKYRYGVCDNYSAAFVVMTRAIGLKSYWIRGYNSSGGGHVWVNIDINGTYYTFDPQAEQNTVLKAEQNNNLQSYHHFRFCKTDAQIAASSTPLTYSSTYPRSYYVSNFHDFQTTVSYEPISACISIDTHSPALTNCPIKTEATVSGGSGNIKIKLSVAEGNAQSKLPDTAITLAEKETAVYVPQDKGMYTFYLTYTDNTTKESGIQSVEITVDDTFISGDTDGSGYVTLADAMAGIRYVAGKDKLNGSQIKRLDIDADGRLTLSDIMDILRYIASK